MEVTERIVEVDLDWFTQLGEYLKPSERWQRLQDSNLGHYRRMSSQIQQLECRVCRHKWYPRTPTEPKRCPNPHCGTANWKTEGKRGK